MLGKLAGALIGTVLARLDTPLVLTSGLMAKGVAEIALFLVLLETVGVLPLTRLILLRKGSWATTQLSSVLRRKHTQGLAREPIDDVLERMADNSLTIIPIMERESASSWARSPAMTSST